MIGNIYYDGDQREGEEVTIVVNVKFKTIAICLVSGKIKYRWASFLEDKCILFFSPI